MAMGIAFLPSMSTYGRPLAQRSFGGFALSLSAHAARECIPAHRHADQYQWCLVLDGGFEETSGAARTQCGAGSFLVRPPDCVHADRFGPVRGLCLNLFPQASWLVAHETDALADTYAHHRTLRLWRLGRALADEMAEGDTLSVESLIVELLASVGRLRSFVAQGRPLWLAAVVDQIESEPASELRLGGLARTAGVSAAHLARTFRAAFGQPLGDYVRQRRVTRAMQLIREGDRPLADIAAAVGFCDQAHFTRAFKAHAGTTPAAFRRGL